MGDEHAGVYFLAPQNVSAPKKQDGGEDDEHEGWPTQEPTSAEISW